MKKHRDKNFAVKNVEIVIMLTGTAIILDMENRPMFGRYADLLEKI